ncbi:MAG: polymerase delta prime subunit [Deltaproteobacteria bacterium]|nr:polymerase delta prime subunit [Deltaproteobacteria bacterium]
MSFAEIAGHKKNIAVIERILGSARVAHAYLFSGPEGVGKQKTALAFIQHLFCAEGRGCGSCSSCRKIASGNHPDIHTVLPDGQFIKIDQVRALQKELSYRPYEAVRKACIIDGAERLNQSSGNALLKTLEEPPGNAIMILLTAAVENVLPTIRSRCQQLAFAGVPADDIEALLLARGVDADNARVAAALADGSVARAIDFCSDSSGTDRREMIERACRISRQDMSSIFAFGELFDKEREKALQTLELLLGFWRDMLHFHSGAEAAVNRDVPDLLAGEAARRSSAAIMEGIENLLKTRQAIQRNANVRLAMDVLGMKLAV